MPANPDDGARYAARVADLLAEVELALLRRIRDTLLDGIDSPEWDLRAAARVRELRARLARDAAGSAAEVEALVRQVIADAYLTGAALAVGDLDELGVPVANPEPDPGPVRRLSEQTVETIRVALGQAAFRASAVYAEAVTAASGEVLGGNVTRRAASQHVLDRLGAQGITGFRDAAGRNWSLTSYAEMAVRATTGQAAVRGHVEQLAAAGLDLVIVSDAPRECPLCRPWEGKVLSLGGRVGAVILPNATGGAPVRLDVTGTLDEARAAGFQHPNCRHSVSAYVPGATRLRPARAEPEGYRLVQRQRALERKVREWKRRQALALDDEGARFAAAKVRTWQTALRQHVDAHDLKRLRYREQITHAV